MEGNCSLPRPAREVGSGGSVTGSDMDRNCRNTSHTPKPHRDDEDECLTRALRRMPVRPGTSVNWWNWDRESTPQREGFRWKTPKTSATPPLSPFSVTA